MRKCANCGKPITDRKTGKHGGRNIKYCLQCITERCAYCGKEFELSSSQITRKVHLKKKGFYCSRDCVYASRNEEEKNNPNWKEVDWKKFKELYYDEKLNLTKVAKKLNMNRHTLSKKAKAKGFSIRLGSAYLKLAWKRGDFLDENGRDIRLHPKASKSRNWKGGKRKNNSGYVLISKFLLSSQDRKLAESMIAKHVLRNYILEHRLVAAKKIGRPLQSNEVVHHLNGIKDDNRPENLVVISPNIHSKLIPIFQKKIRELEKLLYFIN